MTNRILVTYATRTGSTGGVAEAIGEVLGKQGAAVDVRPIQDVRDLSAYSAIVVGSAMQERKWLPEAIEFLRAQHHELARKPVATFTVCMTMAMKDGRHREAVAEWTEPVRSLVRPVAEGFFAGALDISKVPTFGDRVMFRASVAVGAWSEGDHRDWTAIRAWADELTTKLVPQP